MWPDCTRAVARSHERELRTPMTHNAAPGARLERSVLIVPASNPRMIEKAASRAHVIHSLLHLDFGDSLRMFRINALDTPFACRDLIEVVDAAGDRLDLVVVSKVERAEDVYVVETLLAQIEMAKGLAHRIGIEVQIETALGCLNAGVIAARSERVEAILYGPGAIVMGPARLHICLGYPPHHAGCLRSAASHRYDPGRIPSRTNGITTLSNTSGSSNCGV